MAAGTPVVASGIDGYRNVATDGVDALLVEPGDADALATAIARRRSTTGCSTESLRGAGHRRAEAFSMTTLAAEYTRIYRELLDQEEPESGVSRRRRKLMSALREAASGAADALSRAVGHPSRDSRDGCSYTRPP